jgi:hypothetical protein
MTKTHDEEMAEISPTHTSSSSHGIPAAVPDATPSASDTAHDDSESDRSTADHADVQLRTSASRVVDQHEAGARPSRREEEVRLDSVVDYLTNSILKVSSAHGAIPHFLCLGFLVAVVLVTMLDDRAASRGRGIATVMRGADAVTSIDGFAAYASDVIDRVAELDARMHTPTSAVPDLCFVGAVSVRLQRSKSDAAARGQSCAAADAYAWLPPSEIASVTQCASEEVAQTPSDWGHDAAAAVPNNTAFEYVARAGEALFRGRSTYLPGLGRLREGYGPLPPSAAVSGVTVVELPLPVGSFSNGSRLIWAPSQPRAAAAVAEARAAVVAMSAYEQSDVMLAVIEGVAIDYESSAYVAVTMALELRYGATRSDMVAHPFRVRQLTFSPSTATVFGFVTDIFIAIFVVIMCIELVQEATLNERLLRDAPVENDTDTTDGIIETAPLWSRCVSWWMVFDALVIASFVVYLLLAALLYRRSADFVADPRGGSNAVFLEAVFQLQADRTDVDRFLAWLIALLFTRTFKYFRFADRLSLMSQTMASSIHDIFGVIVVLLLVMCSFAYGGVLLWSHNVEPTDFISFFRGFVFLFRFILDGNASYAAYDIDQTSAMIFFGIFFLLSWILLLNVIVGVIALAFAAVMDLSMLTKQREWRPSLVANDLRKWLLRTRPGSQLCNNEVEAAYLPLRLDLLEAVRRWQNQGIENFVSGADHITLGRLLRYTHREHFPEKFVRYVFLKAQQQRGNPSATERKLRLLQRAVNRGANMKERLSSQEHLVDSLHRKVCVQRGGSAAMKRIDVVTRSAAEFVVMQQEVLEAQRLLRGQEAVSRHETSDLAAVEHRLRRVRTLQQLVADQLASGSAAALFDATCAVPTDTEDVPVATVQETATPTTAEAPGSLRSQVSFCHAPLGRQEESRDSFGSVNSPMVPVRQPIFGPVDDAMKPCDETAEEQAVEDGTTSVGLLTEGAALTSHALHQVSDHHRGQDDRPSSVEAVDVVHAVDETPLVADRHTTVPDTDHAAVAGVAAGLLSVESDEAAACEELRVNEDNDRRALVKHWVCDEPPRPPADTRAAAAERIAKRRAELLADTQAQRRATTSAAHPSPPPTTPLRNNPMAVRDTFAWVSDGSPMAAAPHNEELRGPFAPEPTSHVGVTSDGSLVLQMTTELDGLPAATAAAREASTQLDLLSTRRSASRSRVFTPDLSALGQPAATHTPRLGAAIDGVMLRRKPTQQQTQQ